MNYRRRKKCWKYKVTKDYSRQLLQCMNGACGTIRCNNTVYVQLKKGKIIIYSGYTWNGANWSPDFKCTQEATLVHDALYQLLEEQQIEEDYRKCADQQLYCMLKDSSSPRFASIAYNAVRGYWKCGFVGGLLGAIKGLVIQEELACSTNG